MALKQFVLCLTKLLAQRVSRPDTSGQVLRTVVCIDEGKIVGHTTQSTDKTLIRIKQVDCGFCGGLKSDGFGGGRIQTSIGLNLINKPLLCSVLTAHPQYRKKQQQTEKSPNPAPDT